VVDRLGFENQLILKFCADTISSNLNRSENEELRFPKYYDKELSSFKVPTLYLIGENEKAFSPIKCLERLKKNAPEAKIKIVNNAGHDIVMVQPEIVNEKLTAFFKNNGI
jgi:pimeloyl-ACP methyl ester carboxylesterase